MFEIIQVSAFSCQCEKCGHKWISYRADLPTHCANRTCSNPTKWNSPGRSRKYKPSAKPVESKLYGYSGGKTLDDERVIIPIDET
jgi:hypothetical protein